MYKVKIVSIVLIIVCFFLAYPNHLLAGVLIDNINGYSFEYPDQWKAKKFPNSKNLIKGEINKNNNTGMQIRVYPSKEDFREFVQDYVNDFMQQMQKHWSGQMVIISKEYTIVSGYDCFVVSFDFTRKDKKRWFFKQYLWPRDNDVLIIQSGTTYQLRSLNEPLIDEVAKSLKFI